MKKLIVPIAGGLVFALAACNPEQAPSVPEETESPNPEVTE